MKTMSSYRQIYYHIVFRTHNGEKVLEQENIRNLLAFIMGIIQKRNCHLYRINAMEDHVHILCDLHPSVALADLVRDVKASSSMWIKERPSFPKFKGWAEGYGAFTCSYAEKDRVAAYIKGQQEHHRKLSFEEEYRKLLQEHGVDIDDRYFP
jgi:putative transposase